MQKHTRSQNFISASVLSAGLSVSILLLSGCNSPLFEHANAAEPGHVSNQNTNTEKVAECPLAFPNSQLCAELTWLSALNDQDEGRFTLRFWRAGAGTSAGPYVSPGLTVAVKLWMPAMGHGSSPVTLSAAKDAGGLPVDGVFEGGNAYFIMPGDWEIRVQLKQGNTVREEAILPVHI